MNREGSAEGSHHPGVRVSTGSDVHEFLNDSGQTPARTVGERVTVVQDSETRSYRILHSRTLSWILGTAFPVTVILTIALNLTSGQSSLQTGENGPVIESSILQQTH